MNPPAQSHGAAPLPHNEAQRLDALKLYRIMDTASEAAFDAVVELASTICETPIALISLLDDKRQWFKAKVGLDASSTPREQAFCGHAILGRDLMVVEDALADPRFRANPLVQSDPNIRFYAGMPLVLDGDVALGTVCVIDRKPRQLTAMQVKSLQLLQRTAAHLIELRRARLDLEDAAALLSLCSWCRSVQKEDGSWVELHRFVTTSMKVTHSMCPSCMRREMDRLEPRG